MRKFAYVAVLLVAGISPALAISDTPYIAPGTLDAVSLLSPPPAPDSHAQKQDMADVLAAQNARTPALIQRALDDTDIFGFATVLGPDFTAEKAPITTAFLRKIIRETDAYVNIVKDCWQRPRPFVVSKDVHPPGTQAQDMAMKSGAAPTTAVQSVSAVCKPSETPAYSYSYPSGAANMGTATAILLAAIVPEKREALYVRAAEYGENRVILGLHYPSDVEAGRTLATTVIAVMAQTQAFKDDFVAARNELRDVLGLGPQKYPPHK